ncbi:hypothetical protein HMPREF9554_02987, partial [Treponema phagedenis F0421]
MVRTAILKSPIFSRNSKILTVNPKNNTGYKEYLPAKIVIFEIKAVASVKKTFSEEARNEKPTPIIMPIRYFNQIFIVNQCNQKRFLRQSVKILPGKAYAEIKNHTFSKKFYKKRVQRFGF